MSNSIHYRTCHLCEAMCGLKITYDNVNSNIISIKGDEKNEYSRGYHCLKATALKDLHEDPDRLKLPMKKTKEGWQEISWDEAIPLAIDGIKSIQKKYGRDSYASYLGNPSVHDSGVIYYAPGLLKQLKSKNQYSATSLDQLPHHLAALEMFGHRMLLPVPDVNHTAYMLMLGANPVVSRGSIMTAPDIKQRLLDIKSKGGKLVVVDPRKTETAALATEYISIQPGTDIYFLIGILKVWFVNEGINYRQILIEKSDIEELKHLICDWDEQIISKQTSIPFETIREIAMSFLKAPSAVAYGRMGVSTQKHGSLCQWLINILNILSDNFDEKGGSLIPSPPIDAISFLSRGRFNKYQSRIKNLPAFAGEFPTATMADEILHEGSGQIKGLLTIAGNPALSAPNGKKVSQALESLEYMVAIDFYLNETTKHANLILPPVSPLERSHFDLVFQTLSVENYVSFSEALFKPQAGHKQSWEIISLLEEGLCTNFKERVIANIKRKLGPDRITRLGVKMGPYGKAFGGLTLAKIKKKSQGINLGEYRQKFPEGLKTKTKKIHLNPKIYINGLRDLKNISENGDRKDKEFFLIGRRSLRTNNSWFHNLPSLAKGKDGCIALMNKGDLQKLSINSGEMIQVTSRVGGLSIKVQGVDTIKSGVVSIPHGFGHSQKGLRLGVAERKPGVNVNDLTDDENLDEISGNAIFNGVKVTISKLQS